jgi:hypothetical protein
VRFPKRFLENTSLSGHLRRINRDGFHSMLGKEVLMGYLLFVLFAALGLGAILWGADELNMKPAEINRWEGYDGPPVIYTR